ncbi:MAG: NADH-quinone oxidoreductase subunit D, partial [Anaerolineaceae bacterium]
LDYLNPLGNNLAFCLAVEKLCELDVPPRAQVLRVLLAELTRIASHLLWLGTSALDLGAMSLFLYTMREREMIMDIFEMISGQRMMTTYIRPGGLWRDVPVEFEGALRDLLEIMPDRIKEYESLLNKNLLFLDRTVGIGVITSAQCLQYGVTGPILRATGIAHDVRKSDPYSGYEDYDFDIPTQTAGDVRARYLVRMDELRQSLRIIHQALEKLPYGPVRSNNRKFVPPPRSELGVSMEALIHHFKLWTEGFSTPKGSVYIQTESPRGELGVFLESDGGPKPYRIHYRTPSFPHVQILSLLTRGHFVADVVAIIASLDVILGDTDR